MGADRSPLKKKPSWLRPKPNPPPMFPLKHTDRVLVLFGIILLAGLIGAVREPVGRWLVGLSLILWGVVWWRMRK